MNIPTCRRWNETAPPEIDLPWLRKLVAKKLQCSLAVEDELPEDGLAAYGDDEET